MGKPCNDEVHGSVFFMIAVLFPQYYLSVLRFLGPHQVLRTIQKTLSRTMVTARAYIIRVTFSLENKTDLISFQKVQFKQILFLYIMSCPLRMVPS